MRLNYRNFKVGLIYFFSMMLGVMILLGALFYVEISSLDNIIKSTVKTDLRAYSSDIDNKISFISSDVLLLEDIILNRNVLEVNESSLSFKDDEAKDLLVMDVMDWIDNRNVYDQIRVIGVNGEEVFRINYNEGSPTVVEEADLQNKSDRYYFSNGIILDDDVLYFSKIDLNIENGQVEYVDGQVKEMLRIGSTMFDDQGKLLGMILVNYLSDDLFSDDSKDSIYTSFEVINDEGYYLHSDNSDIEYGFMFPDKEDEVFNKYYDYDILHCSSDLIRQEVCSKNTFTSLRISKEGISMSITDYIGRDIEVYSDNGDIFIFGLVEVKTTAQYLQIRNIFLILTAFLLLTALFVSRLIDEVIFTRKEQIRMLEYSSMHDLLTGLPNRKRVFHDIEYLNSRKQKYTILFLDFDKFKEVNDQYGHNVGDWVLMEGSKRLLSCVRETDIVARLGGDEFLILLKEISDPVVIENISRKIKEEISKDMVFNTVTCRIGVSIGVSIQDGSKTKEELLNESDQTMYVDKEARK